MHTRMNYTWLNLYTRKRIHGPVRDMWRDHDAPQSRGVRALCAGGALRGELRGGGGAARERVTADRGQFAAEGRGDTREVKPRRALQDLRPVEVGACRKGERRARAVVDDLRRTLRRALLDEVDAEARPARGRLDKAGYVSVAERLAPGPMAARSCRMRFIAARAPCRCPPPAPRPPRRRRG